MWNELNSKRDVGKPCKRNDMCVWILRRETCILALDSYLEMNRLKADSCDNLSSKETKQLVQMTFLSLANLHHPQNIKVLLPFFGIALLVILGCVWAQEGAEDICRLRKERNGRRRLEENTSTLIRFDDCDSCVVEITSEEPMRETGELSPDPVEAPSHNDPMITLGYQEMKEASLRRSHLASPHGNQEDSGGKTSPKFPPPPKLILETKTPIENLQYCRGKLQKSSFKPNLKERKTYTFRKSSSKNKHKTKVTKKFENNRVLKSWIRNRNGKILRNSVISKFCCCLRLDSQQTEQSERCTELTTGKKSDSFKFSKRYHRYTPPNQDIEVKKCSEHDPSSVSSSKENIRINSQFKNFGILPDSKETNNPKKAKMTESEMENISSRTTTSNRENAIGKGNKQSEEDFPQTLSSFPQVSIDSCDLGFGVLSNVWRILRAIQYS